MLRLCIHGMGPPNPDNLGSPGARQILRLLLMLHRELFA